MSEKFSPLWTDPFSEPVGYLVSRDGEIIEDPSEVAYTLNSMYDALEAMLARYATGFNANDKEAEQARAALRRARGDDEQ